MNQSLSVFTPLNDFKSCNPKLIYLTLIICLHTIKWFQVLVDYTNNSIYTQLNGFKCCYLKQIGV